MRARRISRFFNDHVTPACPLATYGIATPNAFSALSVLMALDVFPRYQDPQPSRGRHHGADTRGNRLAAVNNTFIERSISASNKEAARLLSRNDGRRRRSINHRSMLIAAHICTNKRSRLQP
jgi:hypothetical protein